MTCTDPAPLSVITSVEPLELPVLMSVRWASVMRAGCAAFVWLVFAACGGGGGAGGAGAAPPPPAGPPAFGLAARASFAGSAVPTSEPAQTGGSITIERAFANLSFAPIVYFAGVPGETRNVVLTQGGQVRVFDDVETATSSNLVLDLAARGNLGTGSEQGLLGLAFDPDFVSNRAFYVQYTLQTPLRTRIARFTWDRATDRANPASEHLLLEIPQPYPNHKAGSIAFGPDRRLYIGQGDGGSGLDPDNNAQNLRALLGKMLRIAPPPATGTAPYGIPADNPFANGQQGLPEIWAYGLRNPYRFSFDRETGDLWAGDVGQSALEEIDIVRRGLNYGWRVYEGTSLLFTSEATRPPYEAPLHEYDHTQGVAVIGGYVYRGSQLPSQYGHYLYGDFGSGRVWSLTTNGTSVTSNVQIGTLAALSSFGEDNAGELRLVSLNGTLHKLAIANGTGSAPPARLSQTGLFSNLATATPVAGLIEYDINHGFWSDGTRKRRWLAIPDGTRITFDATGAWQFPVGTLIVKQFEIELQEGVASSRRRLETRILGRRASGWFGLVYKWRSDGSDADLLADGARESLTVRSTAGDQTFSYEYPSRSDCLRCHNAAAGGILGVRTAQLNRNFAYAAATDNQLRALNHIGLFASDIGDAGQYAVTPAPDSASATLDQRARAYLDTNCGICHQPNGGTPVSIDLRAATALANTGALDQPPQAGDLGIANARIVASGSKERSVLWQRMRSTDGSRMPPLGSHRLDAAGAALIGSWIDSL